MVVSTQADGELVTVKMVRFERTLPGPAERVWAFLTEREHLPRWYGGEGMAYAIEPRAGGAVSLADRHIRGVVTQWQPPRRLTHTWNVFMPGEEESRYPESYVSFALEPKNADVRLTLSHLPMLDGFEAQSMMGWHSFLELLVALARGEALEPMQTVMERNKARYRVSEIKH